MTDPATVARDLAASLTAAWNAGDSAAFAAPFAADAEFINIFGMLFVGARRSRRSTRSSSPRFTRAAWSTSRG